MAELDTIELDLLPELEERLASEIEDQLRRALETHEQREVKLAEYKRAYKALPEHAVKNFPWPMCSNVVIPIVAITVDNVVARLMRAFLGTKTPVECEIKEPMAETFEKDFRDWASQFIDKSGARDALRTCFHDMAQDGTVYVKTRWESKKRVAHSYGTTGGEITATEVVDYEGVVWDTIPAADCIFPHGFDRWDDLPWVAHRLRFTYQELVALQAKGMYRNIDLTLKNRGTERDDPAQQAKEDTQGISGQRGEIYTFYEMWGSWQVPTEDPDAEPQFEEMILTYCLEDKRFHRTIYNPFFGRSRHIVRIPYLHIPHEIDGLGVAEQSLPFQKEASTAHNQTIDAATAAIAGIVVCSPGANLQGGEEIHPGKVIKTENPDKDVRVVHLSMGNSTLPSVEQQAAFWNEKRTGISAYNMGVESPVAGSRATATGTTALINEGNQRVWVSIDDMRDAIISLLYLTLQLEQQLRPEGIPLSQSRVLALPQGDLRQVFGLKLQVSSEKVNRDIEVQNFQILITVLNDYYARLMQASAVILNPAFPVPQKMLAIEVMNAAQQLVKRFVERFDVENIDQMVPGVTTALQMLQGVGNAGAQMAQPQPGAAGPVPGQPALGPGPAGGPGGVGF